MELKALKPKLGNWLSIQELRDHLSHMPKELLEAIPIDRTLLETAAEFVEEKRGWWEHAEWESFLQNLHVKGFHLSEEHRAPIGSILEIFKKYYQAENFQEVTEKRRRGGSQRLAQT